MEKVSVVDVFKESVAFVRFKAKLIGGLFGLMLLLGLLSLWQTGRLESGEYSTGLFLNHLIMVVVGTFIQACFVQYVIRTLRLEAPSFVPQGIVGKLLRMLGRELLLFIVLIIPGVVAMMAMIAVPIMVVGDSPGVGADLLIGLAAIIGWLFGFGFFGVRWGAGIAGATVGEKISFKDSWRMTRGYSFALLLFLVPFFAPQIMLQIMAAPEPGDVVDFFSPGMIIVSILSSILFWYSAVVFSVWYVRLTERYTAEKIVSHEA